MVIKKFTEYFHNLHCTVLSGRDVSHIYFVSNNFFLITSHASECNETLQSWVLSWSWTLSWKNWKSIISSTKTSMNHFQWWKQSHKLLELWTQISWHHKLRNTSPRKNIFLKLSFIYIERDNKWANETISPDCFGSASSYVSSNILKFKFIYFAEQFSVNVLQCGRNLEILWTSMLTF